MGPSRSVALARTSIAVWSTSLDGLSVDASILSVDERTRAARQRSGPSRNRFVSARWWMRTILGHYLGVLPGALEFRAGRYGKPFLAGYEDLDFNLTHSAGESMLAVSTSGPVGIDTERLGEHAYDRAAARRVLSGHEMTLVEQSNDRAEAFLRSWVRKEAFAKARGSGLDATLPAISVGPGPRAACEGWWVIDIPASSGWAAALAYADPAVEVATGPDQQWSGGSQLEFNRGIPSDCTEGEAAS